jgi:predicted esterase
VKDPYEHDPDIPPAMGNDVRDLTDEEYDKTYKDGSGGHELPPEVLATLQEEMP